MKRVGKERGKGKFRKIRPMVPPFGKLWQVIHYLIIWDALHRSHTLHWGEEKKEIGEQGKCKNVFCHD